MNPDMEGRLSSAETAIKGLADSMTSLAHTVNVGFDRINDRIGMMSRPNYTLLVSIIGLAAVLGGGAVTWYDRDYIRLNSDIKKTTEETILMGKAAAVAEYQLNQVDKANRDLDERLQREMRLINDKTAGELIALDTRLQGEIRAVDASSLDRRNKSIAEYDAQRIRIDAVGPEVARHSEKIEYTLSQLATVLSQQKAMMASWDAKFEASRKEKP